MGWTAGNGIGELFAEAHAAAGDIAGAIDWYDVVLAIGDRRLLDPGVRAAEQSPGPRGMGQG